MLFKYFIILTILDRMMHRVHSASPVVTQPNLSGSTTISISEDTLIGTFIYGVKATDSDGDRLVYSINSGSKFIMDGTTLKTSAAFDYENPSDRSHLVQIMVSDGTNHVDVTMTIDITDANDNSPVFNPIVYTASVNETTGPGISLVGLTCTDADTITNGDCMISIQSGDDLTPKFQMSGAIIQTTNQTIDYETPPEVYSLVVIGQDNPGTGSRHTASAHVYISVVGVNEDVPIFTNNPSISILENERIGHSVYQYTAQDNDKGFQGDIKYLIKSVSSSGSGVFTIDQASGWIMLSQNLDYELHHLYEITVVAIDGGGLTGTGTVTVAITDVNDNTPSCTPMTHALFVFENETVSTKVIPDLGCVDIDSGSNGDLTYQLTVNPGRHFVISETGGIAALVLNGNLDYETQTDYNLVAVVSDKGSPPRSTNISFYINVVNVNEFPPIFTNSGNYAVSIKEDETMGITVITVSATDKDSEDKITYAFDSTYPVFSLDSSTGRVILTQTLDRETTPQHTLKVTATDDGGLVTTATVTITVTDINEAPVFSLSTYSVSIDEEQSSGISVIQITATDNDAGVNGTVTYTIVSGNGLSFFSINASTGVITTKSVLDYEVQSFYNLVVKAEDGGTPSLSTSCLVIVTLNNINDNDPVFSPASYTLSMDENVTIGTTVTTVVATDADNSHSSVLRYSLSSTSPFSIDIATGIITTNMVLDREIQATYDVVIFAVDNGSPPKTGTSTISVLLNDINDNSPIMIGRYDISLPENTPINTQVTQARANDSDSGENSRLTFTIVNGNARQAFKIDVASGIIQTRGLLDREIIRVYRLIVKIKDNGQPSLSFTGTVKVKITDINDNPPVFSESLYVFDVDENSAVGTPVGKLIATDKDYGINSRLRFSIVGFWSGFTNPFKISPNYGRITVNGNLDRENVNSYNIWCRVSDSGSPLLSSDVNVSVVINDVNDHDPVFESTVYSNITMENSIAGTEVLWVLATDADIAQNADISYSIDMLSAGGVLANQFFVLESKTGLLSVKSKIDRELYAEFNFSIKAVDGGSPSRTSSAFVIIETDDENDNNPIFSPAFYNSEVPFEDSCKSTIVTLTATDADIGMNSYLSYTLLSNSYSDLFTLSSKTGRLTQSKRLRKNTRYLLYADVTDSGTPRLTSKRNATIRIDTYDPSEVAISFHLGIIEDRYLAMESTFLQMLTVLFQTKYPKSYVRRWCTKETSTRSVTVHLYVLKDNSADEETEINNGKPFLIAPQALKLVTADSSGKPAAALTGTRWEQFKIQKVIPYSPVKPVTPWIQTTVGIAVTTSCAVLGTALIIAGIVFTSRYCSAESAVEPNGTHPLNTRSRVTIEEPMFKGTSIEKPILHLPMIVTSEKVPMQKGVQFAPHPLETNSPPTINRKNEYNIVKNRQFDGQVVEAGGNVYAYNTKTNEKKFLKSLHSKVR